MMRGNDTWCFPDLKGLTFVKEFSQWNCQFYKEIGSVYKETKNYFFFFKPVLQDVEQLLIQFLANIFKHGTENEKKICFWEGYFFFFFFCCLCAVLKERLQSRSERGSHISSALMFHLFAQRVHHVCDIMHPMRQQVLLFPFSRGGTQGQKRPNNL